MMSIITRAAVNTFAVIENFRNGSNDILDGLLPFFQPLLEKRNGVEFDSNDFAKEVSENYHWNFTADVAEELIPRFEKKGWLKSESVSLEKTIYVVCCPENSIELNDSEVYDDFKKITEEFKSFCEMLSPITALSYDIDHYQDILIEWLLYVDAYSEENLNIEYRQTVNEEKKLSIRPIIPNTTSLTDDQIYLCARFVEYAIKNNPKIADQLIQIASIGMMTEVVQDFVKPLTSVAASDLIVYLDAPIAMELLGVSGRAARENIQPIVAELQKIGVTIRIFSQSIEEIKRSLNAVLKATTRTGPTARALSQGSVLEAYVRKVASNPEKALLDQNIRVTARTLKSFPNEHEYFDDECNKDLYSSLRFQHNVAAREHDATIATSVMRQRSGYSTKDIFGSKYVILTRNGVFSQASKRACTQLGKLKSQDVGPVIHRRALAMAAWLRTGLGGEKEEVPKRQLLSSCERILSIKPHIVDAIKKFSSELNVEKAAQLELLLSEDRSSQMLMDKTLGLSDSITNENVSQLFDEMLSPHLEEMKIENEEELSKLRSDNLKAVSAEQEKTKAQEATLKKHLEELSNLNQEDKAIVSTLCLEVANSLRKVAVFKKVFSIFIAIILTLIGLYGDIIILSALSIGCTVYLTYMSLIGRSVLGIDVGSKKAIAKLRIVAQNRGLTRKLNSFDVSWNRKTFDVAAKEKSALVRNTLL